jgi:dipeptidyl aminopeptidase/acylaminoacyl peptidase
LSPDGKTVAFLTNISGSNQIWTIDAAGGWPEQRTFFTDRVQGVSWSPRGDWIAFGRDTGGDENFQIYLLSSDGVKLEALTEKPEARHNLGPWSKDGARLAWASNERVSRYFDTYILDVDRRTRTRIDAGDGLWSPARFSNDGKRLILSRANGGQDNDLFVVDFESPDAAPVLLTAHEGIAAFRVAGFTPDDAALWIVSDVGREYFALGRLDLASKKIAWAREPSWDVASASLSYDGSRLAYTINEDGYDRLFLIDPATGRDLPPPRIPRGQIGAFGFSRDNRRMILDLGGSTRNGDVWIADLATGALRQVTRSSTAGIPRESFVEPQLIRYPTFDGRQIPAFFFVPGNAPAGAKLPCLVSPHGGPEGQTVASFSAGTQYYVNRGYAVLAPNVRGSTGYGKTFTHLDDRERREDSVRDLAASVDWLKASGRIDPERIAVIGGSYGGYMVLAAITLYPDRWAAAVDSFGIANFRSFFGRTASYRVVTRASEYGDPVNDSDLLDRLSPIHRVDRITTPLLVLQGANDPRVPAHESEQIVQAVRGRGGVAEYVLFPDEGHGWTKLANQITAHRTTADFLDRHLRRVAPKSAGEGAGASP